MPDIKALKATLKAAQAKADDVRSRHKAAQHEADALAVLVRLTDESVKAAENAITATLPLGKRAHKLLTQAAKPRGTTTRSQQERDTARLLIRIGFAEWVKDEHDAWQRLVATTAGIAKLAEES